MVNKYQNSCKSYRILNILLDFKKYVTSCLKFFIRAPFIELIWTPSSVLRSRFRRGGELHSGRGADYCTLKIGF